MFGFFNSPPKEKSPEELVRDKYIELIQANGISYVADFDTIGRPTNAIKVSINNTKVVGRFDLSYYMYNFPEHPELYITHNRTYYAMSDYGHIGIFKGHINKEPMVKLVREIVQGMIIKDNNERWEKERIAKEILTNKLAEEAQMKLDKICMDEYKKLMGIKSTTEFDKQFAILGEIESLGKEQLNLIKLGEKNNSSIESKRKQFYKIIS